MTINLSGPGIGLAPPQNLYPTDLYNVPYDISTNNIGLSPGNALVIPAGTWIVDLGKYSVLQFLDPITGIWRPLNTARGQAQVVFSDGFTRRIANLTGCPVAAVVENGGANYAQGSTTIVPNVGGSQWQAIVGGALSVSSITQVGANYGVPPLVFIPAPPLPGVPATAIATITNGSVSAVSLTNVGAGYGSAPQAVILPNPADPNFASIKQATVSLVINAAHQGAITAALCTNNGAPLATISALTLTASGAGTGATIVPVVSQVVTGVSVTAGGGGYGTATEIATLGGVPAVASAIGNPSIELTNATPRAASIAMAESGGAIASVSAIYDGGQFFGSPTPVIIPADSIVTTIATVTLQTGGVADTILMQPL